MKHEIDVLRQQLAAARSDALAHIAPHNEHSKVAEVKKPTEPVQS